MPGARTFGWVQNPGDITKLKKVAGIFLKDSKENLWLRNERLPLLLKYGLISKSDYDIFVDELSKDNIEIKYQLLKGCGAGGKSRASALCTGIVQAVIDGQQKRVYTDGTDKIEIKKPYTDDWSAEGYIRWAVSCSLLEYSNENDTCKITPLGVDLVGAPEGSVGEKECYSVALLSYPPVIRILSLLEKKDKQTKFELGRQLGFKGELGFTSIPQGMYLCDYSSATTPAERSAVRSNMEGDSDKYARGIASWCSQMGWVTSETGPVSDSYRGTSYTGSLQKFSITRDGEKALVKARGNSSNPRLPRTVMFEMLASNKAPGADYLRYQRAAILKVLAPSAKSLAQIENALKGYDVDMDQSAILDSIGGLNSIGIEITYEHSKYRLKDKIERLSLPPRSVCVKDNVNDIKDRIRPKLTNLNHKYLILVDLAYSDAASRAKKNADALEFEIQTSELFTKELSFDGAHLGGSNKPDVIVSYDNKGTIIDNKSYKDGLNISAGLRDEMSRYVNENLLRNSRLNPNEWWLNFDPKVNDFTFLFVTSFLKGNYKTQLDYISATNGNTPGAAINVENLLYLSEGIKTGKYTPNDFYNSFKNEELVFTT